MSDPDFPPEVQAKIDELRVAMEAISADHIDTGPSPPAVVESWAHDWVQMLLMQEGAEETRIVCLYDEPTERVDVLAFARMQPIISGEINIRYTTEGRDG